ncbi:MAG: recombinase family protein [Clostridia bacterium]|nr:recombinase family protein [Clostridia bacterium]
MKRKLDVARIEQARRMTVKESTKEAERQQIHETIEKNRRGERKVKVIMPDKKLYAYQDSKRIRVAAYCRVSTAEEAQMNSFEMQVQHFEQVISQNPLYDKVDIYADEGISGTSIDKRKEFQRMIADCKAGKIDLILTKSISRFGRNIVDILSTLKLLDELRPPVAVTFESESISTADGKNKLVISILSALAELESQQKSEAIKQGIRYRMQEGLYKFSVRNIIGYYRDYSGQIKIEPAGAEIVKFIYGSFLDGDSCKEIAQRLTDEGVSSPMGLDRWHPGTIKSILRNEKYCGNVLYQKTYSKSYLTHKTAKNNSILPQWFWEGIVPAIIPVDEWQRVQEALGAGRRGKKKAEIIRKRFEFARVKAGVLRGFYYFDPDWPKDEREQFFTLMDATLNSIKEED